MRAKLTGRLLLALSILFALTAAFTLQPVWVWLLAAIVISAGFFFANAADTL